MKSLTYFIIVAIALGAFACGGTESATTEEVDLMNFSDPCIPKCVPIYEHQ